MPTNSDLVTDLPADFEVFGQGVDTTLADLKGGTSGQILSKNTNADMDFVWINNDQGDITGVTATSPLTGGGTSGAITVGIQAASTTQSGAVQLTDSTSSTSTSTAATPNSVKSAYDLANTANTTANTANSTANAAIPKSTVTAKGSIVTATASSTPAQLAVGNNGETLVADSSTATGLRYQGSQAAGKNLLVNGNFDIWQRGTSFANPAGYFADRFTSLGSVNNITFSQQTTGAPAGSRYILRATATGASAYSTVCQMIETAQVEMLQGSTATYSVKLRVNSTFNATGLILKLQKSATADAGTGATWTDIATTSIALASLPTTAGTSTATYYQGTITGAIPSDGTANSLRVIVDFNGGAASGSIVEYSQFMLELGSVPTTFTRAGGTIQGELAACQRYYYRTVADSAYSVWGNGTANGTTGGNFVVPLPVTLRTNPSSIDYSLLSAFDGATVTAITSASLQYTNRNSGIIQYSVASGLTQWRPYLLLSNNSTSAYIGFNAEL